jgi:glutathione peroxidase-family protein
MALLLQEAMDIYGHVQKFDQYAGKPLLIVNVASKCGFTDSNYKGELSVQQQGSGL